VERIPLSEHRGAVKSVVFSSDGKLLVSASAVDVGDVGEYRHQGQIKLWDVATAKELLTLKGQFGSIRNLALSPDSKLLAFLQVLDPNEGSEVHVLKVANSRERFFCKGKGLWFQSVAFTADGRLFVMGRPNNNTLILWEIMMDRESK
jgi:WD40 repeat protein